MEVVVLQPPALTLWAASHVPVKMDTLGMDIRVQVNHVKIQISWHHNIIKCALWSENLLAKFTGNKQNGYAIVGLRLGKELMINQSIKTDLCSAMCRKRIRGARCQGLGGVSTVKQFSI